MWFGSKPNNTTLRVGKKQGMMNLLDCHMAISWSWACYHTSSERGISGLSADQKILNFFIQIAISKHIFDSCRPYATYGHKIDYVLSVMHYNLKAFVQNWWILYVSAWAKRNPRLVQPFGLKWRSRPVSLGALVFTILRGESTFDIQLLLWARQPITNSTVSE